MDKRKKLGKPQRPSDDFWPLLTEFALSLRGWWISLCAEFDLTPAQGQALRAIDPERPFAMSTLAENLLCDASNVTGIVDKLESRGLIARQGAGHDRRIKMLVVTDQGRELRDRLFARAAEPPAVVAALPAETRKRLAVVLRAVLEDRAGTAAVANG
jgi:DNA-binding MarR family transcriptional regulator